MESGKLITILLLLTLSAPQAQGKKSICPELLSPNPTVNTTTIGSLPDLYRAVTQGMLLNPNQKDIFEIYRLSVFGDATTSVGGATLTSVYQYLRQYPELQKPHFREYNIDQVKKIYQSPPELTALIKSLSDSAGRIRSNLFQIDANLGYWRKLFGFPVSEIPDLPGLNAKANRDRKKQITERRNRQFIAYLNRVISPENRTLLKDAKIDYNKRIVVLFFTLKFIRDRKIRLNGDAATIRAISQAMVDLVHTAGFNNNYYVSLLKSTNAQDRIQGLKMILDNRDTVAMQLGFEETLIELQSSLGIETPTGTTTNQNLSAALNHFEQNLSQMPFTTTATDTIRVRSLSIQEAPFRSCIGGSDCSSRTYFSKALDPNFNYFTMTNSQHQSSGHLTVVLGQAKDSTARKINVAFIDKIQNVPNPQLPLMLEAVRQSLLERGIALAMPSDVGDHNGLSNVESTRIFVRDELLPGYRHELKEFEPHKHAYPFENEYSRAYRRLSVKLIPALDLTRSEVPIVISPGLEYQPWLADGTLSPQAFVNELIRKGNSNREEDVLEFVQSAPQIQRLANYGVDPSQYFARLENLIKDSRQSARVRKQALYQLILETGRNDLIREDILSPEVYQQVIGELKQWRSSSDGRKKEWFAQQSIPNFSAFPHGDFSSAFNPFVDINAKDEAKLTALGYAAVHDYFEAAMQLLKIPGIDVNARSSRAGHTPLMHAAGSGGARTLMVLLRTPGIDINAKDKDNFTALMHAVEEAPLRVFQELIKIPGLEVNVKDNVRGNTALIWAVHYGRLSAVRELLKAPGIDVNIKNDRGQTALSLAKQDNETAIIQELERFGAR